MKAPSWLYEVAPNSYLNTRDIKGLLKLKATSALLKRVDLGKFPPHDRLSSPHYGKKSSKEWFVKTIIDYFENLPLDNPKINP